MRAPDNSPMEQPVGTTTDCFSVSIYLADRTLRLAGYEVYRFAGYELYRDGAEDRATVKTFFEKLFTRHHIIPDNEP